MKQKQVVKKEPPPKPAAATMSERIGEVKKQSVQHADVQEQAQEMLKKIHQIREKLKSDEKAET